MLINFRPWKSALYALARRPADGGQRSSQIPPAPRRIPKSGTSQDQLDRSSVDVDTGAIIEHGHNRSVQPFLIELFDAPVGKRGVELRQDFAVRSSIARSERSLSSRWTREMPRGLQGRSGG